MNASARALPSRTDELPTVLRHKCEQRQETTLLYCVLSDVRLIYALDVVLAPQPEVADIIKRRKRAAGMAALSLLIA